jgi:uncharacterized integral membrane protein
MPAGQQYPSGKEAAVVWFIRSLVIMVGVIAFLWLGMENAGQSVDFTFFTRRYPGLSLDFLMLLVFVSGMIFSFFISVVNEMNLRRQLSQAKREVARVNREAASLRSLPLDDIDMTAGKS